MHLTLGILRQSQAVFYALSFFWLDGFAVPAPAQVTQTVGQALAKENIIEHKGIVIMNNRSKILSVTHFILAFNLAVHFLIISLFSVNLRQTTKFCTSDFDL